MNRSHVTLTDDLADPCGLCVSWRPPDGGEFTMDNVDQAIPYLPSGPVDRLYRGLHDECISEVMAYQEEHRGMPA